MYLLGMTKLMTASPRSSFDRDSEPATSMRTGELLCWWREEEWATQGVTRRHVWQHSESGLYTTSTHKDTN